MIPLSEQEYAEKMLGYYMHLLLEAGMSTEETLKRGYTLAEELVLTLPFKRLTEHTDANYKIHTALLLKQAARALGIDLTSQRSSSEKR